jgi:ribonuclease HI
VRAVLQFDGGGGDTKDGSRRPVAFAAILSIEGDDNEYVVGRRLLNGESHNVAEYTGLLVGMECALEVGAKDVVVYGDSDLVIGHVTGRSKVKTAHLSELCTCVQELALRFESIRFGWAPRECNREADQLTTAVLNGDERFTVLTARRRSPGTLVRDSREERLLSLAASLDDLARRAREMARPRPWPAKEAL